MDHAWVDGALDAAITELGSGDLGPACAVLAEARDQPEVRSLRLEVLADRLVGAGWQVHDLAMDDVNPELLLLAGAIAVREAHVIADRPRDPNAAIMTKAYLRRSFSLLTQAAELVDTDPIPHDLLQSVVAALSPDETTTVWQHVARLCPTLYSAHRTRMDILGADAALPFARETARAAGSGDPRVALVVHAHFLAYEAKAAEFLAAGKTPEGALLNARWEVFRNPKSPVAAELAELSQRFLAAARPHPRTLEAHNLFAAAFTAMDNPELSEPHLRETAGRTSAWAWRLAGGEDAYHAAMQALRDVRHPDVPASVRNHPWF